MSIKRARRIRRCVDSVRETVYAARERGQGTVWNGAAAPGSGQVAVSGGGAVEEAAQVEAWLWPDGGRHLDTHRPSELWVVEQAADLEVGPVGSRTDVGSGSRGPVAAAKLQHEGCSWVSAPARSWSALMRVRKPSATRMRSTRSWLLPVAGTWSWRIGAKNVSA